MSEDADEDAEQVEVYHGEDMRTNIEQLIEHQLTVAINAMVAVGAYITADDLPWSDVKILMLGSRAENILSDLDHMVTRVREQPPRPRIQLPVEALPAAKGEVVEPT